MEDFCRVVHKTRQQELDEIEQRRQRYVVARERMNRKLAIGGAVASFVGMLLIGYALQGGYWLAFLVAPGGAAAGYVIGRLNVGMYLAAAIYSSIVVALSMLVVLGYAAALAGAGFGAGAGQLLMLFSTWLGWIVFGILMGMANDMFDRDHVVI